MRKFIFLVFLLSPVILPGQKTKKISVAVNNQKYGNFTESFYVLRSDKSVRHGLYTLKGLGRILVQGYYKMGRQDSLWMQRNMDGKLRFRGCYSEDKRVGLWEFYNNKNELEQRIDFTKNEVLIYRTQFSNSHFRVFSGSDTIITRLDRPPLYIGGLYRINNYIYNEIVSPLHKAKEKIMGTVYIELMVDSSGRASGHHVLRGLSTSCNQEALRVVKKIPDEWLPGFLNGRNVSANYVIPVIFDENLPEYQPPDILKNKN